MRSEQLAVPLTLQSFITVLVQCLLTVIKSDDSYIP